MLGRGERHRRGGRAAKLRECEETAIIASWWKVWMLATRASNSGLWLDRAVSSLS